MCKINQEIITPLKPSVKKIPLFFRLKNKSKIKNKKTHLIWKTTSKNKATTDLYKKKKNKHIEGFIAVIWDKGPGILFFFFNRTKHARQITSQICMHVELFICS